MCIRKNATSMSGHLIKCINKLHCNTEYITCPMRKSKEALICIESNVANECKTIQTKKLYNLPISHNTTQYFDVRCMCEEQTNMCNIIVKKGNDAPRLQFNAVVLAPCSTDSFALLKALPLFFGIIRGTLHWYN